MRLSIALSLSLSVSVSLSFFLSLLSRNLSNLSFLSSFLIAVLSRVQWRVLRAISPADETAAEKQPDRVVFFDDIKEFLFTVKSEESKCR